MRIPRIKSFSGLAKNKNNKRLKNSRDSLATESEMKESIFTFCEI